MSSFHFYRWNQFKLIPPACTLRTRNLTPNFLRCRTRVNSRADNADNSQSQAASDDRLLSHVTLTASNAGSKQPGASSRILYCGHSTQYSHLVYFIITSLMMISEIVVNTVFAAWVLVYNAYLILGRPLQFLQEKNSS